MTQLNRKAKTKYFYRKILSMAWHQTRDALLYVYEDLKENQLFSVYTTKSSISQQWKTIVECNDSRKMKLHFFVVTAQPLCVCVLYSVVLEHSPAPLLFRHILLLVWTKISEWMHYTFMDVRAYDSLLPAKINLQQKKTSEIHRRGWLINFASR